MSSSLFLVITAVCLFFAIATPSLQPSVATVPVPSVPQPSVATPSPQPSVLRFYTQPQGLYTLLTGDQFYLNCTAGGRWDIS